MILTAALLLLLLAGMVMTTVAKKHGASKGGEDNHEIAPADEMLAETASRERMQKTGCMLHGTCDDEVPCMLNRRYSKPEARSPKHCHADTGNHAS